MSFWQVLPTVIRIIIMTMIMTIMTIIMTMKMTIMTIMTIVVNAVAVHIGIEQKYRRDPRSRTLMSEVYGKRMRETAEQWTQL